MKKIRHQIILIFSISILFFSCTIPNSDNSEDISENNLENYTDKSFVIIETDFGEMKVKLYDETPKHKENFLKLISKKFYDSLLFHKVIQGYIIQSGDPNSKNAEADEILGSGGTKYNLQAEINEKICSKTGVLIAAREQDEINPEKKSSGSQFFIVIGRKFTNEELDNYENQMNITLKNRTLSNYIRKNPELRKKIGILQAEEKFNEMDTLIAEIKKNINIPKFKIPDEHKQNYKEIGGIPNFTGEYTIFGEVIEGLHVINTISNQETGQAYRPVKDIRMKISIRYNSAKLFNLSFE